MKQKKITIYYPDLSFLVPKTSFAREGCLMALLLFSIFFLISVTFGIDAADRAFDPCNKPWARYEYVYPAYRLGCWLGEVPK